MASVTIPWSICSIGSLLWPHEEEQEIANAVLAAARQELEAVQFCPERRKCRGVDVPRDEVLYGRFPYKFAGSSLAPRPLESLPPNLSILVSRVFDRHKELQASFSPRVLINRYANPKDRVGWHSDKNTHPDTPVYSLSFGSGMTLAVREKSEACNCCRKH